MVYRTDRPQHDRPLRLGPRAPLRSSMSSALGVPFHEATIETNGHNLRLALSELDVIPLDRGWSPFTVEDDGPDWKAPLQ